jgi:integrase
MQHLDDLDRLKELDPINRVHLTNYIRYLKLKNLSENTIKVKLWRVYGFLIFTKFKDLMAVEPADIEDYILYRKQKVSPFTLQSDMLEIKVFMKWFHPEKVDQLIKFKLQKPKRKLPVDQLITREDIQKMVASCDTQRDRALIMLLWDSGARINEILSRSIGHIAFDRYGAVIIVDGKTGERRMRLTSCVPDLQAWVNIHPMKNNPNAPLFITYNRYGSGKKELNVHTVQNRLKVIAAQAGIQKRVHPHGIRHARLTDLSKQGFSEMELRIIAGWESSSLMPAVYVHLSGADVENKVLAKAGIITEESKAGSSTLDARQCPRCGGLYAYDMKYCPKCSLILDSKTAMEILQAEEQAVKEPEHQTIQQQMDELQKRMKALQEGLAGVSGRATMDSLV